jgi:hypothetical protein
MMRHIPGKAEIAAAEIRVVQARAETLANMRRIPAALRVTLSKPKSLALLGGAAGLFGIWLERQGRVRDAPPASPVADAAKTTSVVALIVAFVLRQAVQNLPLILQQLRR